jgi:hypothetical protein
MWEYDLAGGLCSTMGFSKANPQQLIASLQGWYPFRVGGKVMSITRNCDNKWCNKRDRMIGPIVLMAIARKLGSSFGLIDEVEFMRLQRE